MKTNIKSTDTLLPALESSLPVEFLSRLCIEEYLDQIDNETSLKEGERQRLGELFHAAGHLTLTPSEEAVLAPPSVSHKPNKILFGKNELTQREQDVINEFQPCQSGVGSRSGKYALGNILVAKGHITRPQLEDALRRQAKTGRRFGEELISSGHASQSQIEGGLSLQRRLIAYALAVTVGLVPMASPAEAAQNNAAMSVSVTVVASAKIQIQYQATQLNVTPLDVERGYVDITGAARFAVSTNSRSGYLMEFNPVVKLFDSVQVNGVGSPVHLGADGGTIALRDLTHLAQPHELNFRFTLNQNVKPGNYPWPLLMSVRAL